MGKPSKVPEHKVVENKPENKYSSKKKQAAKEIDNVGGVRKSRSKTRKGDGKTNQGGDDSYRQAIEKEIQRTQMLHPHESDEESVETTKGSNVYKQRYSLQLHPHPSNSHADTEMINTAKVWFKKMKETDEGFAMIPWKKENERKFTQLKELEDIPTQFGQFKNYFHRANPKDEGGRTYIDIYIKHTRPFAEIREDLSP